MSKEFITCDMIRDAALKLVHKMYTVDHFMPDIIYDSLRGGAYMANVMSEYYKLISMKEKREPVFYAAVVARSYGKLSEHSEHVDIDGWTVSPKLLDKNMKVLIVDDIFDTGMTVNALVNTVMEQSGILRENIKVAVYDYKVPLYKKESLPIQPDYWCRKHVLSTPEESRWIHYTCHEFIGLTDEEIDQVFTDEEVKKILHEVL